MFESGRYLDQTIVQHLDISALELEKRFEAHILAYYGMIHPAFVAEFRTRVERLASRPDKPDRLAIFLTTEGGSSETTEELVDIIRYHYGEVYFVVPDLAMSAGTILCMSGNKIFMDYSSSLGPIDPQVITKGPDGQMMYVPALGYLDKVEELVQRSRDQRIAPAEFAMLQNQDLGMLRRYEQARDLAVDLLKRWLVAHKFSDWTVHRTNQPGEAVTPEEKEQRAQEIADQLGDNKIWHSHGRRIGIGVLREFLKLEIEDYGEDPSLQKEIRAYSDLMVDYAKREGLSFYIHSVAAGGGSSEPS